MTDFEKEAVEHGETRITLDALRDVLGIDENDMPSAEDLQALFGTSHAPVLIERTFPNGNKLFYTYYPIRGQEGKAREVPTHKTPEEYGVARKELKEGRTVVVPAIIDPTMHGDPCEAKSRDTAETYPVVDFEFSKFEEN